MSDHSGLNDLVDQIKQVTTDIKAANTNFGQRLDSVEDNINTLFRKTSRPGPESGDVGFDRKEAFKFCKSRRAITVNTVEERDYSPSNAEVDQPISAQHALKAYLCHGDLDRLGPEHRKSLSAFSFGPPGNFLLPPTQANRVLSCLVYPTNLSGLVSTISISGPSLVFLIDNARFQLGTSTLILGGMVRANAAPITETHDFNVTFPAGAAFSTWDGSFTITFDPTGGAVGPSALDAFSSNLPASYDPFVFA